MARMAAAAAAGLRSLARLVGSALGLVWRAVKVPLLGALNILAALIVLFEEWGWRPLAELLGYLARLRLVARLELMIAGLPPYGALLVFALPTTILLPVKLIGLWLLAKGQAVLAGVMLVGAKIVSTALVARIFMLTKPALMRIGWFAWAYGRFMPWKEALFASIRASWAWRYGRMVKTAVKHEARQAWARWRPLVLDLRERLSGLRHATTIKLRLAGRQILQSVRSRFGA